MKPILPGGQPVRFKNTSQPKQGAVLILLYPVHSQYYFPLIQRPLYDGVHSGQMALPGGKQEDDDRSLIHTAIRETEEEIGVRSEAIQIVGNLTSFYVAASNHQVLPVIGFVEQRPLFIPDQHEVDEVVEVSLADFMDSSNEKEKEITVSGGYQLTSPYFDVNQKVVWGATAMMLSEFKMILNQIL
ncbi:MAG: CoA pyrophosphatase [Cyclobacteriaceae bacterium]|nr:CoA pyrophosphatase [Cyclobacteriaceae bacterium HetDA_MAG_MS6]